LHIRLHGIRQHFGASYTDLTKSGFKMKSLFGEDAALGAPNRRGMIEPTKLFNQIYEEAADTKPKSIALDASADVFAGNEIDRLQVRQFVGLLRKLAGVANAAVILLSHPSLTGISSGSGLSGSTAWHNSVRARMYLTSPKPEAGEQPDSDLRELLFKKNNYGPKGNSIVLRYANGLFLPEKGMSTFERAEYEMKAETAYLDGLRKLQEQGQSASPQIQSPHYAPRAIAQMNKTFRVKDLETAQQRLLDAKRINIVNEGKPSRPVRRISLGSGLSEEGEMGQAHPPHRTEGAGGGAGPHL
jgi:RecA-family ATPase